MNLLKSIAPELKHIIDAMYSVTNIDITIVDENLNRIVATNNINKVFRNKAPVNSVFHKSLMTGKQYLITDTINDPLCLNCFNKDSCNELAELCIPIHFNGKIIGVLGMCAFNEKARDNIINNKDSYIKFENQLSNIICTILSEKRFGELLEYRSTELVTLINSLNEGIIILDNNMKIMTKNNYINERLDLDINLILDIEEIIPKKSLEELDKKHFYGEVGPVKIGEYEFIINSNIIKIGGSKQGIILVFSDFNKMKESVLKSDLNKHITTFDNIIGESELLINAKRQAIQVAEKDVSVLLIGETGTGKEIFARAIHTASHRREDVFMAINCGAIPENLIESELFGYEKGSFTGANTTGKVGKFEIAKEGTLFLDEIGDLPYSMQVKILRALEEKEITKVGGHKSIKVNPRVISATHRDLHKMVREGCFREDLLYRLNVVPIYIPPLRERGYDIIMLSRYFLNHFSKIYKKDLLGFSAECEKYLLGYSYPGNIRELKNLIEYATIFEEDSIVGVKNIRKKIDSKDKQDSKTLAEMTKIYEKTIIENYLNRYGNSLEGKTEVAKQLGISMATLYRKIE
ncbi:sigma 54-interacting transcriptional regulator [Tissierella pigra]|uniref:AAA domain-containing protein n=1 Tax=Tissierella pigra TaxID=2607614 RepID=A0A6N7XF85_9FIRM|nr:sigma 54-interacting transcriptional regulator [Tissierella pigra]MSU00396.1 AAA domain-containing protein [Tissierella pigra]